MTVHYASYGSNMDDRRFKPYVLGGPVPGTDIVERGSSDRTPIDLDRSKLVRVPGLLFTAGNSQRWDGKGVAFVDLADGRGARDHHAHLPAVRTAVRRRGDAGTRRGGTTARRHRPGRRARRRAGLPGGVRHGVPSRHHRRRAAAHVHRPVPRRRGRAQQPERGVRGPHP
ncbi:hypothetical protein ACU686_24240 [Yinghuangia aomiensis]